MNSTLDAVARLIAMYHGQVSERVKVTDSPIIVKTKQFIAGRQDVLSLAQGAAQPSCIGMSLVDCTQASVKAPLFAESLSQCCAGVVHWTPPPQALDLASEVVREKSVSAYGPCAGLPALISALKEKLATQNKLPDVSM